MEKCEYMIEIGEEVVVSDPCYSPDTWCQGVVKNMLPGFYHCGGEIVETNGWGRRVSKIRILHETASEIPVYLEEESFEVGVDSGQAGIYDAEYYYDQYRDKSQREDWYNRVCDATWDENSGFAWDAIDGKCIVSASGYGDGSYVCRTGKNAAGQVIYVEIDYGIEDEEDDEWDDDYNYDESDDDDYEEDE